MSNEIALEKDQLNNEVDEQQKPLLETARLREKVNELETKKSALLERREKLTNLVSDLEEKLEGIRYISYKDDMPLSQEGTNLELGILEIQKELDSIPKELSLIEKFIQSLKTDIIQAKAVELHQKSLQTYAECKEKVNKVLTLKNEYFKAIDEMNSALSIFANIVRGNKPFTVTPVDMIRSLRPWHLPIKYDELQNSLQNIEHNFKTTEKNLTLEGFLNIVYY